ncbi:MAG TPA: thiol:disulfide interchange protein DsbG [Burkholderiales bacterium]|nr:thiol:disulfide interchange protein DsbG [Burkholderiales bacterium]
MKALNRGILVGTAVLSLVAYSEDQSKPQYASKPDFGTLFQELEKADFVSEGAREAKSVLYVFFDPNCYFCHLTWKALQPYENVGLQVRWVPVAYQKPSSVGRAAAIMEAADRIAALRANELNYDKANYDGGIQPMDKPRPQLTAQLQANTRLMQQFGSPGTPLLVWKDNEGKVQTKPGVPRLSQLPAITGLPEQKVSDPELANFR